VRRIEDRGKYTWLEVVLAEGKNREVRRIIEAVGFKVLKLVRTGIGPLALAGMEIGKWRELTPSEVAALRKGLNLEPGMKQDRQDADHFNVFRNRDSDVL
jgi:16S rRNA U516 pseudouridylate synthase RsuA-like enzyme